jgi:hypothetical protein
VKCMWTALPWYQPTGPGLSAVSIIGEPTHSFSRANKILL